MVRLAPLGRLTPPSPTPQHFYKVSVLNIVWLLESSAFDVITTFELVTIH